MEKKKEIKRFFAILLVVVMCITVVPAGMDGTQAYASSKYVKMKIVWFDVGAGDSVFMRLPNNKTVLIDGGIKSQGDKVVRKIKDMGYSTVNYCISTHPDADHVGGLQTVFKKLKVKRFYYPGDVKYDTQTAKEVIRLAKKESGCRMIKPSRGTKIKGGNGCTLKFVQSKRDYSSDNEDSLAIFVNYKKLQLLTCGDNEDASTMAIEKHNVDVLQLPHHGSKYATSASFVKRFDPEKIVVSTDGKKYGHPNKEVFQRCKAYDKNIKVWRTDKKGEVVLYASSKKWSFAKKGVAVSKYCKDSGSSDGSVSSGNVYITATGSKYHSKKSCRGLSSAKSIYKVTKKEARSRGLSPCSICY